MSYNILFIPEKNLVVGTKVKVTGAFKVDFCGKKEFFTHKSSDCYSSLLMLLTEMIFLPYVDLYVVMMRVPNIFGFVTSQGHTDLFFEAWFYKKNKFKGP